MAQDYGRYSPASHMRWLVRAFRDPRYVTVNGRPLFLVYDAASLPQRERVLDEWRATAAREGVADPYICGVMSPGNRLKYDEYVAAGFDAVTEFYPRGERPLVGLLAGDRGRAAVQFLKRAREVGRRWLPERARPIVHSYSGLVRSATLHPPAGEKIFPCVMPSWDNSPRRGRRATIIQNDDAELYANWLRAAVRRVEGREPDERLVFINAWNEWGEGCHLEPDLRNGRRFLESTATVLEEARRRAAGELPRLAPAVRSA